MEPAPAPAVATPPRDRPVLGARFGSAAAALGLVGRLVAAQRFDAVGCHRAGDSWWVLGQVEPDLWRTAVDAAGGVAFVRAGRTLVRDTGIGPATAGRGREQVDPAGLTPVTVLDLVRVAGLQPVPPTPLTEAFLLLPGFVARTVLRRALDLGLHVEHRLTRLFPLFSGGDEPTTMVEVALRGDRNVSPALLAAVARSPLSAVCRRTGSVLVQHGTTSPLDDAALAAVLAPDAAVLADAGFGCWRVEPVGEWVSGVAAVETDLPVVDQRPLGDHGELPPTTVRLVPALVSGQQVDAALLDEGDLATIALLLPGHPLAEIAIVVPGADRHLLTAPGGLLQNLGVGEPLACVGPGPLYVPLGRRLSPHLPSAARAELFRADEQTAVVVLDGRVLAFSLRLREPVWHQWVQGPPEIETQLPAEVAAALSALDDVPPPMSQTWGSRVRNLFRDEPVRPGSWRDDALTAELAGDLVHAADLHRRNNDPLRAAHLYERAAREAR
ncbi:hypothetical protein K7G98_03595 [Saccharothrix sp. MB29]|nr:hypothetical protein [Saccharothrix sp. MB29]